MWGLIRLSVIPARSRMRLNTRLHPVLRERQARLGEEEMVLPGAAPLGQFLLTGAVAIQVVQEVAQAVLTRARYAVPSSLSPLPRSFHACGRNRRGAAHKTRKSGYRCRRAARGWRGCAKLARSASWPFSRWRAGEQELFEFFGLNGPDQRPADLGEHHPIKRVAFDDLLAHQPVEEGAHRTSVGLDRAFGSRPPMLPMGFAQVSKPGAYIGGVHFANQGDLAFLFQERLQKAKGGAVPFQGFRTVIPALVILT